MREMETERWYIDNQITSLEKLMNSKFDSIERAVKLVEVNTVTNNEKQNEFRGQLKDQADRLATKEFVESVKDINIRQNDAIRENMMRIIEKQDGVILKQADEIKALKGQVANFAGRIIGVGAALAVLEILLKYVFK